MSFFNMIGRWWGLLIGCASIVLAGLVGRLLPSPLTVLVGMAIVVSGALIMLHIGDKYQ